MICTEPFNVFISVAIVSPHLPHLFRRILQNCFAVKLQKCCVDDTPSPDFHPLEGEQIMNAFTFLGEPITRTISKQSYFYLTY